MVMVNAVSMDNVEHAYAVQQLRKSGKNAKIVCFTLNIHSEVIKFRKRYIYFFFTENLLF